MVNKKIVDEWIKIANKDLVIAGEDVNKKGRLEYVGFLCQQSAEKFLKAYIVASELTFQKTHDLEILLEICAQKDPDFNQLQMQCRLLTPFYIEARYPDFEETPKLKRRNIQDALKYTQEVARFVLKRL